MFTNVQVNDTKFQVANIICLNGGFRVVGITENNEAKTVDVIFGDNFGVTYTTKAKAKTNPQMIVEVAEPKRKRGRPAGSKNKPAAE